MEPFGYSSVCFAFVVASLLAVRGIKKRSLSVTGGITGFVIGFLIVSTGLRGLLLFVFYQFGSWSTKYKNSTKQRYDDTVVKSSCRGPVQVLAVSIIPTCCSVYHAIYYGPERSIQWAESSMSSHHHASMLSCAILAHHATGLADTLASEMGILSSVNAVKSQPVLITQPWKYVPPGTNGGVTIQGLVWSMIGGFIISSFMILFDYCSGILIPESSFVLLLYGIICGLLGSIIDSILGATIQATYYNIKTKQVLHHHHHPKCQKINNHEDVIVHHICGIDFLTNEQVNFVSMAITSYIGGWIISPWLFTLFS